MKTCVITENFPCDQSRVWLYLNKPTLGGWRTDLASYEESQDGMRATEQLKDGRTMEVVFTRREKPRRMDCEFSVGKIKGRFIAILLGGGDSTSLECTLEVEGLGLFAKPQKLIQERLTQLQKALNC